MIRQAERFITSGLSLKDDFTPKEYNDSIEKVTESLFIGSSPRRYICEVHREIYDIIETHIKDVGIREKLFNLLAEAYYYGKRMSDRLKELRELPPEDVPENPNFRDDLERRAERLELLKNIYSVQIQTIDWCNRKCDWCPNKYLEKSRDNLMSEEVLSRLLKQLLEYGFKGEIRPYLMGEALMDRRILDIIVRIRKYFPSNMIKLATNGDGIGSTGDIEALFEAGVNRLHINHYTGKFKDIDKARDKDYPNITHFGLGHLKPTFYNRAGKVDYVPKEQQSKCDWFLHKLYFRTNGDLILCCSDYNYEVVFGNIMKNPLASILSSNLYRKYYYAHKEGKGKSLPVCDRCNHII